MKLRVLILGYGEMGHALEFLLADKHDVHIWNRSQTSSLEEESGKAHVILFCLPVNAHLEVLQKMALFLTKASLCLSIAKGLDESGKTAAQILSSVLSDQHRYGVIYGPMISEEIVRSHYAFADVALSDGRDFSTLQNLFVDSKLVCRAITDMTGCSWSVILKNVYAIMFGIADGLQLGDNMRGYLAVTALSEISAILTKLGAEQLTPYGYAGLGDLITTATSESSHHHELGRKLATGQYTELTGEGVHTLAMIEKFHLFEHQAYPLFSLIRDIISKPENLKTLVDVYLDKLQVW